MKVVPLRNSKAKTNSDIGTNLSLVRSEGNVNFFEGSNELGHHVLANLVKTLLGTSYMKMRG